MVLCPVAKQVGGGPYQLVVDLLCNELVTKTRYGPEVRRLFRITFELLSQVQNMSLDRADVWMATIFPDLV